MKSALASPADGGEPADGVGERTNVERPLYTCWGRGTEIGDASSANSMEIPTMLPLKGLSLTRVDKVAPGHLLVCDNGTEWELALRIQARDPDSSDLYGLMPFRRPLPGSDALGPVVQFGYDDTRCVDLGIPQFAWTVEVARLGAVTPARNRPGSLLIRKETLSIAAATPPTYGLTWCNLADGTKAPPSSRDFVIDHWALGLPDVDGKFETLLRFPEDFAPGAPGPAA